MSYILDALKKSEQEREQGAVPTLRTLRRVDSNDRRLRQGVLIGGIVFVAVAAAAWFIGSRLYQAVVTPRPPVASESIAEPAASKPQSATIDTPEPADKLQAAEQAETPDPAASTRVGNLGEPGPDARARVAGLSVNAVSYSEAPERRFVMLNQRIVRESEMVSDGIIVNRITPEGVILGVGTEEILLKPE